MTDELRGALYVANLVFTAAFVVEMLLKWVGLGGWCYFAVSFNVFDCVIVIVSPSQLYPQVGALGKRSPSASHELFDTASPRLVQARRSVSSTASMI